MSKKIYQRILEEMGIFIKEKDKEDLYKELLNRFSIIGMAKECEALESMWKEKQESIESFVFEWFRKRTERKKKKEKKKEEKEILVEV